MDIRGEIKKYSADDDIPVLLWLLSRYSLESRWRFVAKCSFKDYGKYSYQTHRIWSPTEEGIILYKYYNRDKGETMSISDERLYALNTLEEVFRKKKRRIYDLIYLTPDEKIEYIKSGKVKIRKDIIGDRYENVLDVFYYPGGLTEAERKLQKKKFNKNVNQLMKEKELLRDFIMIEKDSRKAIKKVREWGKTDPLI